jgi:hypothetical protein
LTRFPKTRGAKLAADVVATAKAISRSFSV